MQIASVCLSKAEGAAAVVVLGAEAKRLRGLGIENMAEIMDNVSRRIIVAFGHVPAIEDGVVVVGPKIQPEAG